MEEIEVTARFSIQGKIIPINFVWNSRSYRVHTIGRNWQAKDGLHILVMTRRNQAYHLLFNSDSAQWFLIRGGEAPTVPSV